jgi:hypothetical protein
MAAFACTQENSGADLSGGGDSQPDSTVTETDGGMNAADTAVADMMVVMPEPDDAGMTIAEDCDAVCDRFVECAAEVCPMGNGIVLRAACRMSCLADADFASGAAAIDDCTDLVTFVGRRSPSVADRCGEPTVPQSPLCEEYATLAASCLQDVCPNSAELGDGAPYIFSSICSDGLVRGTFSEDQLVNIADANCQNLLVSTVIGYLTVPGNGMGSGQLAGLCNDGPANDAETCDSACRQLAECIPEGTPEEEGGGLRDYGSCRYLCGAFEALPSSTWECVGAKDACGDAFACFDDDGTPETVQECVGFGQLISRCIQEDCAQVEPYSVPLAQSISGLCDYVVSEGYDVAEIEMITNADTCGPLTEGWESYYLEVSPDSEDGSGLLVGLCSDMPSNPPEVCTQACENLANCIPEDSGNALADRAVCGFYCSVVSEGDFPAQQWQCVSESNMCEAVGDCFP